ncbi:hypothetical protein PFISCL1PPCAC_25284, partial [Pristionchus fissidentatus]
HLEMRLLSVLFCSLIIVNLSVGTQRNLIGKKILGPVPVNVLDEEKFKELEELVSAIHYNYELCLAKCQIANLDPAIICERGRPKKEAKPVKLVKRIIIFEGKRKSSAL